MSMMEERGEALGFEREICWMSEQAERWLDRVDRSMTDLVHVDRLARTIAALEGIEREANAKTCFVAAHRAKAGRRRNPLLPRRELPGGL
jgi:hypothetical protein